MELAMILSLVQTEQLFAWVADGIRVLWTLITLVAAVSIVVMLSHLVPRKEY